MPESSTNRTPRPYGERLTSKTLGHVRRLHETADVVETDPDALFRVYMIVESLREDIDALTRLENAQAIIEEAKSAIDTVMKRFGEEAIAHALPRRKCSPAAPGESFDGIFPQLMA